MQTIEFADILSTDLQLAHTGYLTHALTEIARTGHRYVQPMREERATLAGRSLAFLI